MVDPEIDAAHPRQIHHALPVTHMHYGYIGLGNLGAACAGCLVKAGFEVTVYDLNPALTRPRCHPRHQRRGGGSARSTMSSPACHRLRCRNGCCGTSCPICRKPQLLGRNVHPWPGRGAAACRRRRRTGHPHDGTAGHRRRPSGASGQDHHAGRRRPRPVRPAPRRHAGDGRPDLPHGAAWVSRRSSRSSPTCWPSST